MNELELCRKREQRNENRRESRQGYINRRLHEEPKPKTKVTLKPIFQTAHEAHARKPTFMGRVTATFTRMFGRGR